MNRRTLLAGAGAVAVVPLLPATPTVSPVIEVSVPWTPVMDRTGMRWAPVIDRMIVEFHGDENGVRARMFTAVDGWSEWEQAGAPIEESA